MDWTSCDGFQEQSNTTTRLAAIRLTPSDPALVEIKNSLALQKQSCNIFSLKQGLVEQSISRTITCSIGVVIAGSYFTIITAKYVLRTAVLDELGFFDAKLQPILAYRKVVNTRAGVNAFMINHVHIPYYEARLAVDTFYSHSLAYLQWLDVLCIVGKSLGENV